MLWLGIGRANDAVFFQCVDVRIAHAEQAAEHVAIVLA